MTDTLLKTKAMDILVKNLGVVETERFITLVLKEPFDYTKWRSDNLQHDISINKLNQQAIEYWEKSNHSPQ